jgi:hypothetical protein
MSAFDPTATWTAQNCRGTQYISLNGASPDGFAATVTAFDEGLD